MKTNIILTIILSVVVVGIIAARGILATLTLPFVVPASLALGYFFSRSLPKLRQNPTWVEMGARWAIWSGIVLAVLLIWAGGWIWLAEMFFVTGMLVLLFQKI